MMSNKRSLHLTNDLVVICDLCCYVYVGDGVEYILWNKSKSGKLKTKNTQRQTNSDILLKFDYFVILFATYAFLA